MVQIDGLGVEAATRNGDSSNLFFADGNYAEYSIDYSGNTAEVESGGVRVNMIPRDGSNLWAGQFFGSFSSPGLQSNNVDDALVAQGIEKDQANRLSRLWFANPAVGGPIVRDRLWFWASHTSQRTDQYVASVFHDQDPSDLAYTPDPARQAVDDQLAQSTTLRLTAQATPRNKFTFFYDNNYNKRNRFLIGSTLTSALNVMPEAAVDLDHQGAGVPGHVDRAHHQPPAVRGGGVAASAAPELAEHARRRPRAPRRAHHPRQRRGPGHVELVLGDGVPGPARRHQRGPRVAVVHHRQPRVQGRHEPDERGRERVHRERGVPALHHPAGLPVDLVDFYATPSLVENDVPANLGLYAQDQWTLDRLTLNLGVRWDYFNAGYPDHDTGTSRYRPVSATFPGQQVVGFKDIQPRLGMAYDLFGNGRTALKASFGRYADRDSNARAGSVNPRRQQQRAAPRVHRLHGNGGADCDPLNPLPNGECIAPSDNLAFGQPVINTFYDPEWAFGWGTRHANYESSVSVQHEVAGNVSVNVGWFHRAFVNFDVQDNRAVGPDDFGYYSLTAPADDRLPGGGGYTLNGFADVNPDKLGQFDTITTGANAFGGRSRTYAGFDFSVDARLDTLLLRGGVSTGRTSHDNCAYLSALPEIHMGEVDGNVSPAFCDWSTPYLTQLKLLGSYTFPGGITFAGTCRASPVRSATPSSPTRATSSPPRSAVRWRPAVPSRSTSSSPAPPTAPGGTRRTSGCRGPSTSTAGASRRCSTSTTC